MVIAKSNLKDEVQGADRSTIRKNIVLTTKTADKLLSEVDITALGLSKKNGESLKSNLKDMKGYIEYAPWWVILSVAIALGLGTMVAWKRIVVTIGEKIGKTHMSYSQGASAEIVAASTIALSTQLGLPVSTTHMLSSGVAGSMVADGGVNNLDFKTVKTILSAWVLTIPVTVVLSAGIFLLLRWIIL
jgi:PiT family inorganic phosphate transporter